MHHCTLRSAYYVIVKWCARLICIYNCFQTVSICTPYDGADTFENDFPIYLSICSSLRVPNGVFCGSYRGHNLARGTDYGKHSLSETVQGDRFRRGALICETAQLRVGCDSLHIIVSSLVSPSSDAHTPINIDSHPKLEDVSKLIVHKVAAD